MRESERGGRESEREYAGFTLVNLTSQGARFCADNLASPPTYPVFLTANFFQKLLASPGSTQGSCESPPSRLIFSNGHSLSASLLERLASLLLR